jgi:hypothetical protein
VASLTSTPSLRGLNQRHSGFHTDARDECFTLREIPGTHVLEHVWQPQPNVVMVLGSCDMEEGGGVRRVMGFIDIWSFNADGCIERRQTFLSLRERSLRT